MLFDDTQKLKVAPCAGHCSILGGKSDTKNLITSYNFVTNNMVLSVSDQNYHLADSLFAERRILQRN